MKNILVFSPHPDDAEFFMGGTIAKEINEGAHVRVVVLTDGRRSPRLFKCTNDEMAETRRKEGEKALKILGVKDRKDYGFKNTENTTDIKEVIKKEITLNNWDEIYIPDTIDAHPTHAEIAKLVLKVSKELKTSSEIWAYDGWNFLHSPDKFVDIEGYLKTKLRAVRAHKSQLKDKPYDKALKDLASVRAIMMDPHKITHLKYAEAFKKIN